MKKILYVILFIASLAFLISASLKAEHQPVVLALDYSNEITGYTDTTTVYGTSYDDMVLTTTNTTGNYVSVYIPSVAQVDHVVLEVYYGTTLRTTITGLDQGWYIFDIDADITTQTVDKFKLVYSNDNYDIWSIAPSNYNAIKDDSIITEDADMYNLYNEVIGDLATTYSQGLASGFNSGYTNGYNDGYTVGETDGITSVFTDSNSDGHDDSSYTAGVNAVHAITDHTIADSDSDGNDDISYNRGYNQGALTEIDFNLIPDYFAYLQDVTTLSLGTMTIGALIAIPLGFAVFNWFIRKMLKG